MAQAESRAHRIGQEGSVVCRYLLAKGTADDEIWTMLKNKQNVLNKAGLFHEDLADGTHSAAPSTVNNFFFNRLNKENALLICFYPLVWKH